MPLYAADSAMVGNLAEWAVAVVALLALIVAGVAAKATTETNRAQQKSLELQRQQVERAQASKVTFYLEDATIGQRVDEKSEMFLVDDPGIAYVLNTSDLPIFHVNLIDITIAIEAQTDGSEESNVRYHSDYLLPTPSGPVRWELNYRYTLISSGDKKTFAMLSSLTTPLGFPGCGFIMERW